MAERYYDTYHKTLLDDVVHKNEFILYIVSFMNEFRYTVIEKDDKDFNVDKFISQRMMYHLKCFFNEKKRNKTIKKAKKVANHNKRKYAFTRKH
jgi:hypothetical protein